MNENLKKLAEQADVFEYKTYYDPTFSKSVINDDKVKKFAELIVQDNIRTLRSNGYDDAAQCLQDIHFGIKDPI
jgi:hypothetical protein